MVDVEKDKTKGEEVHEEIQRIRYVTRPFLTPKAALFRSSEFKLEIFDVDSKPLTCL